MKNNKFFKDNNPEDKDFDQMIRKSFKANLDDFTLDRRKKEETIEIINQRRFISKIKKAYYSIISILDYEVEIPVKYAFVSLSILLILFTYQINSFMISSYEIELYNIELIENNYGRMN